MSGYVVRPSLEGIPRGLSQTPLGPEGVIQAHTVGHILKPRGVTSLRASLLKHTVEFTSIVGKDISVAPVFTTNLDTLDIGELARLPEDKAEKRVIGYILNSPDRPFPGGESVHQWLQRIWPEIHYFFVLVRHGRTPVIVTHGRVPVMMRALIAGDCKTLSKEVIQEYPVKQNPGEIYQIDYADGRFSCKGPLEQDSVQGDNPVTAPSVGLNAELDPRR